MLALSSSIRVRLLALAAVWLAVALLGAYAVIGSVLDRFVTDRFDAEAQAVADTLIAQAAVDDSGRVILSGTPADPRFGVPLDGWFWQLDHGSRPVGKSPSLFDMRLNPAATPAVGARGWGPRGERLRVLVRDFTLPGLSTPLTVTVTAPQAEIDAALAAVRRPLALSLVVLGVGLACASLVQVSAGLASLDALGGRVRAVREGQIDALPLPREAELRPLAVELNELIRTNANLLARSRDHLGNLAHSLKTPLAALANTLPADHPGQALIARMDRQIGWHLRRARSAGSARRLGTRTPVRPVVDDILLVLQRPLQDRDLAVHVEVPDVAGFAGDRQDLEEMLGNLLENAVKWAARRIRVSAQTSPGRLIVQIADDGPGMSDADHARALSRGVRVDETGVAGTGLGLAIVADLAALHGGRLRLGRAPEGGLLAELTLPA